MLASNNNSVCGVMKIDDTGLSNVPSEIDLRWFRRETFGDTFHGGGHPSDGWEFRVTFYGTRAVYLWSKYYDNGRGCGTRENGNKLYQQMSEASNAYHKIVRIARAKYFEESEDNSKNKEWRKEPDWDCVQIEGHIFALLADHPQFAKVVEEFGMSFEEVPARHGANVRSLRVRILNENIAPERLELT